MGGDRSDAQNAGSIPHSLSFQSIHSCKAVEAFAAPLIGIVMVVAPVVSRSSDAWANAAGNLCPSSISIKTRGVDLPGFSAIFTGNESPLGESTTSPASETLAGMIFDEPTTYS